jgi:methyl-accepting chemotaxis protein
MRFGLGAKLASGFAVPLTALVVVVVALFVSSGNVNHALDRVDATTAYRAKSRDLLLQLVNIRYALRGYALTRLPSERANRAKAEAAVAADVAYLREHAALVPSAAGSVAALDALVVERNAITESMFGYADNDRKRLIETYFGDHAGPHAAIAQTIARNKTNGAKLDAAVGRLLETADGESKSASASLYATLDGLRKIGLIVGVIAFAASLVAATLISRGFAKRVHDVARAVGTIVSDDLAALSAALHRLANGDLRSGFTRTQRPLGTNGTDAIDDLIRSHDTLVDGLTMIEADLDAALASLRDVVGGVIGAARAVAAGSDESAVAADQAHRAVESIARSAEDIARGAVSQADSIVSASTAIEELARAAQQIALAAHHQTTALGDSVARISDLDAGISTLSQHGVGLSDGAQTGVDQARAGADAVGRSRAGMQRLRDASAVWGNAVESLVRRSSEATAIVTTIEAFADQSNLLALNAAIEAARAGEHGRGFAVVADEVRKLAERSTIATREVRDILGAMERETAIVASTIREAGLAMEQNAAVVDIAGEALAGIASSAQSANAVARDVAHQAIAMRDASAQITTAIGSVSSAVEENAAAASQMRSTTTEIESVMVPIAASAEQQSVAASHAARATGELAAGIGEIEAAMRSLRDQARGLDGLVARFTLSGDGLVALTPRAV